MTTIYGGGLPRQPDSGQACARPGPGIIDLLDRMGVPFTALLRVCSISAAFGGTLITAQPCRRRHRAAASLCAGFEQVRRYESEGKVKNTRVGSFFRLCSIPTASAAVSADGPTLDGAEDLSRRRHHVSAPAATERFSARATNSGCLQPASAQVRAFMSRALSRQW